MSRNSSNDNKTRKLMNDAHAQSAEAALLRFQQETGADDWDALKDLLCDLMHWSDRSGYDFEVALRQAKGRYETEITWPLPEGYGPIVITTQRRVSPLDAAKAQTPRWLQNIQEFNAMEIQPHMIMRGSSCGDYLEPCAPEEAEVWVVNGRYRVGGIEPCKDFPSKGQHAPFVTGSLRFIRISPGRPR